MSRRSLIALPGRLDSADRNALLTAFEAYKQAKAEAKKHWYEKLAPAINAHDNAITEAEKNLEQAIAEADRTWREMEREIVIPTRIAFEHEVRRSGLSPLLKSPIELEKELEAG